MSIEEFLPKKDHHQLALATLLLYEEPEYLSPRAVVALHHLLSCIYQAALINGQHIPKVRIVFPDETICIRGRSDEANCLTLVRESLTALTLYPVGWTVAFELSEDDCWLENVVFSH